MKERVQYVFRLKKDYYKSVISVDAYEYTKAVEAVRSKYPDWIIEECYTIMPSLQAY